MDGWPMPMDDLETRLRIIASKYGREYGWYVEHDGRRVAVLTEPRWADLFWVSYTITPAVDDLQTAEMLDTYEFWTDGDLVYRNREFPNQSIRAQAILRAGGGEVTLRGLYLTIREPSLLELLCCCARIIKARKS